MAQTSFAVPMAAASTRRSGNVTESSTVRIAPMKLPRTLAALTQVGTVIFVLSPDKINPIRIFVYINPQLPLLQPASKCHKRNVPFVLRFQRGRVMSQHLCAAMASV